MINKSLQENEMKMRDVIDLVDLHETQKASGRHQEIQVLVGKEIKELISAINFTVIDDITLGIAVIDLVKHIYSRCGVSQPDLIELLYANDDRQEEMDLAKTKAETNKINAQAASASS